MLGYIVSPDGAEKLCDNETPRYNLGDETFEWRNHTDTDSTMEIFVTSSGKYGYRTRHQLDISSRMSRG